MEAKSIVDSVNDNVSNAKLQAQRLISHGEGVLNAGTQSLQSAKAVVVKGGKDVVHVVKETAEELKRTLKEGVNDVSEKLSRIATPTHKEQWIDRKNAVKAKKRRKREEAQAQVSVAQ
ncbi:MULTISPECIES: hypothetical protein [Hydrocarboniphaga]|jgi:hypothetical protein|uniref:Phasin domain-containing protein n=1 Tax=Hydrocarboniphaga effusa AP103 TaxID=1172194 RepID=I8HZ99_9GAMM|nr:MULTISPECIES: hypothetical protein [Hydrocarboniphaga]EIT68901.1 hypothetical protein WQQ_24830 [Hydrocarboniphaga effusa AP103]MDZ4080570.1 hypothetical protein [Hydrocarboniphaga sp.]